jgi:phosphatidylcholine synthase
MPTRVNRRRGRSQAEEVAPPASPPSGGHRAASRVGGEGRLVRVLAWGVHAYTALGLVLAARIAVLVVRGGAGAFREAFALMLAATLVDATDGTLARRVGVKRVLPRFDGRKLDDLVDFLTYTCLPLLLIWRAEVLPAGSQPWLLVPLLASAYGFSQVEAKTDDGYFLGFPSLWNVVAFYLYVLRLPGEAALAIVTVLGLLTFVPSRYLYPTSRPGRLNVLSNILGAAWTGLLIGVLWRLPIGSTSAPAAGRSAWWLALVSLYYPAFYLIASWAITLRYWRRQRDSSSSSLEA